MLTGEVQMMFIEQEPVQAKGVCLAKVSPQPTYSGSLTGGTPII